MLRNTTLLHPGPPHGTPTPCSPFWMVVKALNKALLHKFLMWNQTHSRQQTSRLFRPSSTTVEPHLTNTPQQRTCTIQQTILKVLTVLPFTSILATPESQTPHYSVQWIDFVVDLVAIDLMRIDLLAPSHYKLDNESHNSTLSSMIEVLVPTSILFP